MATEDILIRYRADVGQLEADLNKLIKQQEELVDATKANTDEQKKSLNAAEFAAKKRADLLRLEEEKLKKLQAAQKLAFDPVQIEKFNRQISESQNRIRLLSDTAEKSASSISNAFTGAAAAIAAAFSVDAIVNFGQQSINAFVEAENASNKLRTTIVTLGGEGEAAFDRLNAQAEKLAQTTLFDDEDIRNAQAQLSVFGLTADEIERFTPALLEFATVSGQDLNGAVTQLGGAINGLGRGLDKYGISVSQSATQTENFNSILQGLVRFEGQAAAATETLGGRLIQKKKQVEELQESIGDKLVPVYEALGKAQLGVISFFESLATVISENQNIFKALIPLLVLYTTTVTRAAAASAAAAIAERAKAIATGISNTVTRLATFAQLLYTAATVKGTAATVAATAAQRIFNIVVAANPVGLLLTVLSAVAIAYYAFADSAEEASESQKKQAESIKELNEISGEYNKKLAVEKNELDRLFAAVKQYNTGSKERQTILNEINQKYGLTLQNLSDEKQFVDQLKTAYEALLPAIEAKFRLEAGEARFKKAIDQQFQATQALAEEQRKAAEKETRNQKELEKLKKEAAKLTGAEKIALQQQIRLLDQRYDTQAAENNALELARINKDNADKLLQQERDNFTNLQVATDQANSNLNKSNEEANNKKLEADKKANAERNKNAKEAADEAAKIEAERQKALQDAFNKATDEFLQLRSNAEKALADLKFDLNTEGLAPAIQEFQQQASVDLKGAIDQLNTQIAANPLAFEGLTNDQKLALLTERFGAFVKEIDDKWKQGGVDIAETSENIAASLGPEFLALPFEEAIKLLPELAGKYLPQFKNSFKNTADEVVTEADKIAEANKKASEIYADSWIAKNKEVLDESVKLANELIGLFKNITDKRIDELNRQTEAQLEYLEKQDEINKEEFENRAVSEREFLAEQTRIENERLRIQEEAAEKEKSLKRQQFIAEQAAAIFQIGIKTTEAIAEINADIAAFSAAGLIPLAANAKLQKILLIAQSVAQVAAILAQPKPYRKGSKDTGPTGHMARVGEEGEEIVFMPGGSKVLPARQTNKYGEVLDAMFDNKLDSYILNKYVTPALMAQKQKYESEKGRSFADNLAKSIYFNGLNANDMERIRRKGQPITNVDELADAIARKIPSRDIYR
jgi:hypothetical protein